MNYDQLTDNAQRAEQIVDEAAKSEGVTLHRFVRDALLQALRVHHLTQPGVYAIIEAVGNVEREAGRLPMKNTSLSLD